MCTVQYVEEIQCFGAAALQKKLESLAGLGNVEPGIGMISGELVAISGLDEVSNLESNHSRFGEIMSIPSRYISETGSIVNGIIRRPICPSCHQ